MASLKNLAISILFFQALLMPSLIAANSEPLKIVYNTGVAPLKFEDESGGPAGLFPDLWQLWAQKAGRKIQFVKVESFAGSLDILKAGKADLHAGLFKTPEREQFPSYSEPYKKVTNAIYVRDGIEGVNTVADLSDRKIVVVKGDPQFRLAIRNDWPVFRDVLQKAMDSISNHTPLIPDLKGIDTKKGIQTWQNAEAYKKALRGFAHDYENAAEKIKALVENG